jgi:nucleoside-diphosphate-sugar epimerase
MVYGDQAPGNINTLKKIIKFYYILPFKGINNQRNFIHVLNLVQVIHGIIEKGISGKIIVADETSISTYQLVRCLSKLNAKKRVFINVNFIWHIVNKLAPDLGKKITGNLKIVNNYSYEYLGLSKIYTLKEGLEEMLN